MSFLDINQADIAESNRPYPYEVGDLHGYWQIHMYDWLYMAAVVSALIAFVVVTGNLRRILVLLGDCSLSIAALTLSILRRARAKGAELWAEVERRAEK